MDKIPFETLENFIAQYLISNKESQLPLGKGVELSMLHSELSKLTEGKFNYKHYGFSKFIKLLESIPHIVTLQTNDGKLFRIFLSTPSLRIEQRPLDLNAEESVVITPKRIKQDSVINFPVISTPKPISQTVGSFYISSGHIEFNLPITNDTSEIILLDLDNTAGWATQFLQYALHKNDGNTNISNVICVGFCGIAFEVASIKKPLSDFLYVVKADIPNKEVADHAITFFSSKILLEHKLNQELGKFDERKLIFTVVSKDMALANTVHFLKSSGAEAKFVANSSAVSIHCKINEP